MCCAVSERLDGVADVPVGVGVKLRKWERFQCLARLSLGRRRRRRLGLYGCSCLSHYAGVLKNPLSVRRRIGNLGHD